MNYFVLKMILARITEKNLYEITFLSISFISKSTNNVFIVKTRDLGGIRNVKASRSSTNRHHVIITLARYKQNLRCCRRCAQNEQRCVHYEQRCI